MNKICKYFMNNSHIWQVRCVQDNRNLEDHYQQSATDHLHCYTLPKFNTQAPRTPPGTQAYKWNRIQVCIARSYSGIRPLKHFESKYTHPIDQRLLCFSLPAFCICSSTKSMKAGSTEGANSFIIA